MNFDKLHICIIGLHPLKSYDNLYHLVQRIENFKNFKVSINIIHDTTDKESLLLKQKFNESEIGSKINWIQYESAFLNSGKSFKSRNYASLIMQHEPIEHYLSLGIPDDDFIFRCRSDYYLTDEFLKMILDKNFYNRLDNDEDQIPIFNKKVWMPYMGTTYFLNCCDYFFVSQAKDQREMLITDDKEARSLWNDSFLNEDRNFLPAARRGFAERIFFIKPMLNFLRENKINKLTSNDYWQLVNSNFCYGGDPSPIKTCFFGWRGSAWQGLGNLGIKHDSHITKQELERFSKKIEQFSKINSSKAKNVLLLEDKFKF